MNIAMALPMRRWKIYANRCLWVENFIFSCATTGAKSAPAQAVVATMASPAADVAKIPREGGQVVSNRIAGYRLQVEDKQKNPVFRKTGFYQQI
jgi:hypothetical protein